MFETQNHTSSAWERLGKLQPLVLLVCFIVASPIVILFGFAPAVEGDFTAFKIVLPYSAILLFLVDPRERPVFDLIVFGISAVQFLFYSIVISSARKRVKTALLVLLVHSVFVAAALICGYIFER